MLDPDNVITNAHMQKLAQEGLGDLFQALYDWYAFSEYEDVAGQYETALLAEGGQEDLWKQAQSLGLVTHHTLTPKGSKHAGAWAVHKGYGVYVLKAGDWILGVFNSGESLRTAIDEIQEVYGDSPDDEKLMYYMVPMGRWYAAWV